MEDESLKKEITVSEEDQNAAYSQEHRLPLLFSDIADALRQANPQSETEAERVVLEFLSQRRAERDRAALRLRFNDSFEVALDNKLKYMKLVSNSDQPTLYLVYQHRNINDQTAITLEEMEELIDLFYELGKYTSEVIKRGQECGYIVIDDKEPIYLTPTKECYTVGDELFSLALQFRESSRNI